MWYMGFLDRLFGPKSSAPPQSALRQTAASDVRAIERYRYLLRIAPPDAIEQAHTEAFAQLTPEQRAQVLQGLTEALPEAERGAAGTSPARAEPEELARMATRAELRQPGTMARLFGGRPGAMDMHSGMGGLGMGGMFAGTLLSSIAGAFIGSAIANQFLGGFEDADPEPTEGTNADAAPADATNADYAGDDSADDDFGGGDFDL
jgi:hypothetical protein